MILVLWSSLTKHPPNTHRSLCLQKDYPIFVLFTYLESTALDTTSLLSELSKNDSATYHKGLS